MQKAKDISELIKNWVQIAAVILGGIWAYYTFGQKEAPSLEQMADIKNNIFWSDGFDSKSCRSSFKVTLQNIGNSSFDITKVKLNAWLFERSIDTNKILTFLNLQEIKKTGQNIFEKVYSAEEKTNPSGSTLNFIDHYPPGFAFTETFEWEVKNSDDKWICFEIEFYEEDNPQRPKWINTSWDKICNTAAGEK